MPTNNAVNISSQGTVYFNGTGTFSGIDGSTSGFVYTSTGTGAAPSFQAIPALTRAVLTRASGSALSLATTVNGNVISLSLPSAGTWMCSGIVQFAGTPTVTGQQQISISATTATHGTLGDNSVQAIWTSTAFVTGSVCLVLPSYFLTVASSQNIFLVASGIFSGGTMTAYGRLNAYKIA